MTTTEQIQEKLQTANLYQISKSTGIAWQTLYNIRNGKVEPHASTLNKLVEYFDRSKKLRKTIEEIRAIAAEYVENNMQEYECCENCTYFNAFTDKQVKVLIPIFGKNIENCGICKITSLTHDEPIILNKNTNKTDAEIIIGEENCFTIDNYTMDMLIQQRYDAIEQDYWE